MGHPCTGVEGDDPGREVAVAGDGELRGQVWSIRLTTWQSRLHTA